MFLVVVFIEEVDLMAQAANVGFGRAGLVLFFSVLPPTVYRYDKPFSLSACF